MNCYLEDLLNRRLSEILAAHVFLVCVTILNISSHKDLYNVSFLGMVQCIRGRMCLDLKSGRMYMSRHVIFDEQVFPFTMLLNMCHGKCPFELQ